MGDAGQRTLTSGGRMMHDRIFHYQPFVEAHLISLLSTGKLKLSRADSFNDPWDCRVHYQIPTDLEGRKRVMASIAEKHRKRFPSITEAQRALRVHELASNPSKFEETFTKLKKDPYTAVCKQYRI